jgi:hypothetical protein
MAKAVCEYLPATSFVRRMTYYVGARGELIHESRDDAACERRAGVPLLMVANIDTSAALVPAGVRWGGGDSG